MKERTEFHVERDMRSNGYALRAIVRLGGDRIGLIEPLSVRVEDPTTPQGAAYIAPMLTLSPDDARGLMDELWRAGVRPTEHGSPGQLAATERHLEDMRRLVFEPQPTETLTTSELARRFMAQRPKKAGA